MGNTFNTLAKTAAVSFGAIAAAVGKITQSAATNYAEYEQLIGGTELMFGDAYDFVAEKAENAYKTVQMSQNEYLTQVNGFATGLKTALGGNEQAAAELADRIIQAEADIVAATGNTQEAVQNAFNGIMRSNFTMLDNLQLGITPTKEGFEELINQVNAWNETQGRSTNYVIGNLADMQSALVDYVEMQGLAGYASMEAADTIQGSISSMRGAWENFLTALSDPDADVGAKIDALADSAFAVFDNLAPRILQIIPRVTEGLNKLIKTASPYVADAVKNLLPALIEGTVALFQGLFDAVQNLFDFGPIMNGLLKTAIAGLGGLVVAVKAVTFAVGTLIPAWKALSAAFTASPLGVVTVGIVAVVAAVAPLIDSLTKVNRMAEELSENALDAADALKEIEAEASNTVAETYAAADAADKYLDRLDELEQKTELTADEQAEYASIVEKLRATLPDVTIEIDEQTGKLKESTDAIREQTKAWQEAAVAEALLEKRKALYAKQADVLIEKTKNENRLMELQRQQSEILADSVSAIAEIYDANGKAVEEWGVEEWNTFLQMSDNAQALQSAYWLAQDEASKLKPEIDALNIAIATGESVISDYEDEMRGLDDIETALAGSTDDLAKSTDEIAEKMSEVAGKAQALREAYNEAYSAAKEMVDGSSKLFQDMSERSQASLDEMIGNEQSRADFYTEYSEALSKALEAVPESMRNAVISMADMSADSLAQLQAIGNGSDEEIQKLAEVYEAAQKAQEELAENLALAATDFQKNKELFVTEAKNLVEELDQYDAMYAAGENSGRGYVEGLLHAINSDLVVPGAEGMAGINKGGGNNINIYQTFDSTATQSEIKMRAQSALEVALTQ